MAYNIRMEFVETSYFTKQLSQLLSDDEYAMFQGYMVANPRAGDVIQGTGGLRKVRWAAGGAGKRAGARVIYFYAAAQSQIRLLLIYKKGVQDDLTADQKKALKSIIDNW
jgi:hypothetical protein